MNRLFSLRFNENKRFLTISAISVTFREILKSFSYQSFTKRVRNYGFRPNNFGKSNNFLGGEGNNIKSLGSRVFRKFSTYTLTSLEIVEIAKIVSVIGKTVSSLRERRENRQFRKVTEIVKNFRNRLFRLNRLCGGGYVPENLPKGL